MAPLVMLVEWWLPILRRFASVGLRLRLRGREKEQLLLLDHIRE